MDLKFKKIRGEYHWWYPAPVEGETARRSGVVGRDHLEGDWWARIGGNETKGRGSTRREAIEDAEMLVFGNSAADQSPAAGTDNPSDPRVKYPRLRGGY